MRIKDHPAVAAWRQVASQSFEPVEIAPVERFFRRPRKSPRPVYRLTGIGGVGAAVIAKRCGPIEAARELAVYRELLPRLQMPHPRLLGAIEAAPGGETWLFLEEVQGEPYRPELPEHRRLAGRSLGILHSAASRLVESSSLSKIHYLYDAGPDRIFQYLDTSRRLLTEVRSHPALAAPDLAVLAEIAGQCDLLREHWPAIEVFCAAVPRTLVHGDLLIPNLRVGGSGEDRSVILLDWGRCGWAVPALDLTRFLGSAVAPDLGSYLREARQRIPALDTKTVRRLAYVGELFRWLDAVRWELESLKAEVVERAISRLRIYRRWMDSIRHAAPWRDNPALADGDWRSYLPSDS